MLTELQGANGRVQLPTCLAAREGGNILSRNADVHIALPKGAGIDPGGSRPLSRLQIVIVLPV